MWFYLNSEMRRFHVWHVLLALLLNAKYERELTLPLFYPSPSPVLENTCTYISTILLSQPPTNLITVITASTTHSCPFTIPLYRPQHTVLGSSYSSTYLAFFRFGEPGTHIRPSPLRPSTYTSENSLTFTHQVSPTYFSLPYNNWY